MTGEPAAPTLADMTAASPQPDGLRMITHESRSPEDRAGGLGALIRSWMDEEDAGEQRETIEYLVRALDEDRLSDRKLFPRELKGKSW